MRLLAESKAGNSSEGKPDRLRQVWKTNGDDQHQKTLGSYAAAKQHQEGVSAFILAHHPELVKEYHILRGCASWLRFHHYFATGESTDEYRLREGITCKKHLLCNCCAIRRSAILVKTYEERIRHLLTEHPDWVPVLITKTVKNGPDLDERFRHITKAHRHLVHNRRNALTSVSWRSDSVLRYVHGAAGSYEFKRGSGSSDWHPHMHEVALLDGSRFSFTQQTRKGKKVWVPLEFEAELRREWNAITGDSYIIDVRRIDINNEKDFFGGFCEAFKYALKMNELDTADQIHAYKTLKGRRLVYSYGALWGLEVPDDLSDAIDDLERSILPYEELLYRWQSDRRRYKLEERIPQDAAFCPPARRKNAEERKLAKERAAGRRLRRKIENAVLAAQAEELATQAAQAGVQLPAFAGAGPLPARPREPSAPGLLHRQ